MNLVNLEIDAQDVTTYSGSPTEPVTLAEAKNYLRLNGFVDVSGPVDVPDYSDDDDLIGDLITEAREAIERYCGLSLIPKTWKVIFTNMAGNFELPYGPVGDIVSFTYFDGNDIDAADYVIVGNEFKRVESPMAEKLIITYEAGYSAVPKGLKNAILAQVAYMYEHRGDEAAERGLCANSRFRAAPHRRIPAII